MYSKPNEIHWKNRLLVLLAALFFISCNSDSKHVTTQSPEDAAQNGDIIFQESESAQSKAIQLATHSKYSHCGIIFEAGGEYFVFEAIQPVQSTPLEQWIQRGNRGHYVVKRLKNASKILTNSKISEMKTIAKRFAGKDYDLHFDWSNDKMYCSELIYKLYNRATGLKIGKLQQLKDFDLTNPVVKEKLAERYGDSIPYTEKVISPASLFDSELLETVISN